MPETSSATGEGEIIGFDPFQDLPTSFPDDPAAQAMMDRINKAPTEFKKYDPRASDPTVGPQPEPEEEEEPESKVEGGLIGSNDVTIEDIAIAALQSPDESWAQQVIKRLLQEEPELMRRLMSGGQEVVEEGFLPDIPGGSLTPDPYPQDDIAAYDRRDFGTQNLASGGSLKPVALLDGNEFIFSELANSKLKHDDEPSEVSANKQQRALDTMKNYNGPYPLDLKVVEDRNA